MEMRNVSGVGEVKTYGNMPIVSKIGGYVVAREEQTGMFYRARPENGHTIWTRVLTMPDRDFV